MTNNNTNNIILTEQEARTVLSALNSAIDAVSRIAEKVGPPYSTEMEKRIAEYNELANIINSRLQARNSSLRARKTFDLDF